MARKKRKGFARPGSTVMRKVGKRLVRFKANSASAQIPGKLVPRAEKPNTKSNTIPGFKKKRKRRATRKRKVTKRRVRRKSPVRRRKVARKRTHTKKRRTTRRRHTKRRRR